MEKSLSNLFNADMCPHCAEVLHNGECPNCYYEKRRNPRETQEAVAQTYRQGLLAKATLEGSKEAHDGGVGWNPQGVFCGECSRATCRGCVNEAKAALEEKNE